MYMNINVCILICIHISPLRYRFPKWDKTCVDFIERENVGNCAASKGQVNKVDQIYP